MTTRRKLPPRIEPRATTLRPLSAAQATTLPSYAAALATARAGALRAIMVIAPLGALAGTVSACGGAAPVQPSPAFQDPTRSRQSSNRWGASTDQDQETPALSSSSAAPPVKPVAAPAQD